MRYWGEWLGVVLHPFRYVAFLRAREAFAAAFVETVRAEAARRFTYVGPAIQHPDGRVTPVTDRQLPVC